MGERFDLGDAQPLFAHDDVINVADIIILVNVERGGRHRRTGGHFQLAFDRFDHVFDIFLAFRGQIHGYYSSFRVMGY
ncbi:hypothetical protein D3C76_1471690 [compost metagenome]